MDPEGFDFGIRSSDVNSDDEHDSPSMSPLVEESVAEAEGASNAVTGNSDTNSGGGKRQRTSKVWDNYHFVKNFKNKKGANIGKRAVCNECGSDFSCTSNSGTGHLNRHWNNKHANQTTIGQVSPTGSTLSKFTYSQPRMREGLACYVAAAEQPFTFGEDIRFEYFVHNCLNPSFSKVSRNTTKSDTLKAFTKIRNDLITEISKLDSTFAFTSDLWTGRNDLGYICVTAHYVDSSWILNKKIIAFRLMEFPHDANHIFQCINAVFREFGLVDKVFSITFDNATANTSAIDLFKRNLPTPHAGQFFHMRCVCHIFNLVVQDGLRHIAPQMEKIRNAILFICTSPSRRQEFEGLCESYNVKRKRLKTDVRTRWNSTFLMLESFRNHSDVITAFVNARYGDNSLTPSDWRIAFEFMDFLKVFYDATTACSGVRYPTSCLVLNHLYNISLNFASYRTKTNFVVACKVMEEKFRKYFEEMPPVFIVATIMDPRIKLEGVVALLQGIAENLMITLPSALDVNALLTTLYATYESKFASTAASTAPLQSSTSHSNDPSWSLISRKGKSTISSRTELFKYLEIDYLTEHDNIPKLDILGWWKKNVNIFPILSIMAHDLLTPPVSSVASESAFSAGNRVLDERRSRLGAEILDCLICLKDWEDARLGIQSSSADDYTEYYQDLTALI